MGKGTGAAVHRAGGGGAGGEGMREGASGTMVHHWQRWNTGRVRPKQREGGRITGNSTCEEEWTLGEGEGGKKGEGKDAGGRGCGC